MVKTVLGTVTKVGHGLFQLFHRLKINECYRQKSSYVFYSKLPNLKPLKLLN